MSQLFYSLSSGSSGNCYYLGNENKGILIDAGIPAGKVRKFLKEKGLPMKAIMGVLISHNHSDHTRGLELLIRKYNIPVYTTEKVWNSILSRKINVSGARVIKIDLQKVFQLAAYEIEAFPVSHDAPETVGFHLCTEDFRITIATDLGHICQTAAPYIKAANLLVIESNYDEDMLKNGKYPPFLKTRILSDHGHLSNHQTAEFLADNAGTDLRIICLAHLSNNNNTPDLALQTLKQTFAGKGININGQPEITILNRNTPSEVISF